MIKGHLREVIIIGMISLLCSCAGTETVRLISEPQRSKIILTRILPGGMRETAHYSSPCDIFYNSSDYRVYMTVSSPLYESKAIDLRKISDDSEVIVKLKKINKRDLGAVVNSVAMERKILLSGINKIERIEDASN